MALKDLLVHVDATDAGLSRAEYALSLAEAHGAHVVGVALSATASLPYGGGPEVGASPPAAYLEAISEQARQSLSRFVELGEKRGVAVEQRLLEGSGIELPRRVAIHARHADLAVLGQPDERASASEQIALFEELLFSSGRPVLLVPYVGAPTRPPRTVLLAWDGSATASRAIHDALPLTTAAKSVIVFVAEAVRRGATHGAEPGADIALHLARHGVKPEVSRVPVSEIDVGNLLLSRAADLGADLIVMGGYHHSRLREYFIGGVTRKILEEMTVPVLMAH